jgi:hypothetical protein
MSVISEQEVVELFETIKKVKYSDDVDLVRRYQDRCEQAYANQRVDDMLVAEISLLWRAIQEYTNYREIRQFASLMEMFNKNKESKDEKLA